MSEAAVAAERTLVGMALLEAEVYTESGLPAEHFSQPQTRAIWSSIGNLVGANSPVDELLVSNDLQTRGLLDAVGGLDGLLQLTGDVSTTTNAAYYAGIVRNGWLTRAVVDQLATAKSLINKGYTGEELLDRVSRSIDKIASNTSVRLPNALDACREELRKISDDMANPDRDAYGLSCGLGLSDLVPGGIPRDKVTLLFGETGNFKTTAKDNLIDHIAKEGAVLNFSLEDSGELTRQSQLARLTGISYSRIATRDLTDQEIKRLDGAILDNRDLLSNVITVSEFIPRMSEIVRIARQYKRTHNIVAVFVDYVQLLDYGADSERIALGNAVKEAQRASHRDRVGYILLSQVNRAKMVNRGDFRPELDDLFGSSTLQHCAKLAIGVYRPWKYDPIPDPESDYGQLAYTDPEKYKSICELWVRKNRLGAVNEHVKVSVDLPTGKMGVYNG